MQYKALPIGIDNFEMLITRDYYYIDKTLLIKDLIDNKASVNLFTRPRRFGKTLNMSMLQYYFEKRDKDNSYLFENLKIMKAGEKYTSHMGQYPVINLSLKSAKQPNFELAYISIRRRIAEEYRRHEYILKSEELKNEKERFLNIVREQGDEGDYIDSLFFLSQCLEKYHKKKTIILIDEYDVPLENSFFEGFYDRMITFIRSLFESVLKTNSSLEFGVITGCLRISKESIFTGLNNLEIISILNKSYDEIYDSMDNLWNFMVFTGYFKKVSERMDIEDNHFITLKIPNKEVKYIFKNKILKWFHEKVKVKDLSRMYEAILNKESEILKKSLERCLYKQ
jgi:hypothetical protein